MKKAENMNEALNPLDELEVENEVEVETEDVLSAVEESELVAADLAGTPTGIEPPAPKKRTRKTKTPDDVVVESAAAETAEQATPRRKTRAEILKEKQEREEERALRLAQNQMFWSGISSLQAAQKTGMILHGQIIAVESMPTAIKDNDGPYNIILAYVMLDERYKVLIPFEDLYRDNPIDMSTVDTSTKEGWANYERRQRQLVKKLFGVEISFTVEKIDVTSPDDYAILGSRVKALAKEERRNFGERSTALKEGDFCEATILSVGDHALFVNLGGVDAQIPLRKVTYAYLLSLKTKYEAGQQMPVYIEQIRKDPTTGRVSLVLSGKQCELQKAKQAQMAGLIKTGMETTAQIVSVRPSRTHSNRIVIMGWLNYLKMPVVIQSIDPRSIDMPLTAGHNVRVEITEVRDSGFIQARFRGFANIAKYLFGN